MEEAADAAVPSEIVQHARVRREVIEEICLWKEEGLCGTAVGRYARTKCVDGELPTPRSANASRRNAA